MPDPLPGKELQHVPVRTGGQQTGKQLCKEPGVLVETKSNINQQCPFASKKYNSALGCIMKTIARSVRMILPSTGEGRSGVLCAALGFQGKKDWDLLEQV